VNKILEHKTTDMRALPIIVGCAFLIFSTAYSQQEFKKGFIVFVGGDTISGLIYCKAFGGLPKNPTCIKFKPNPVAKASIYSACDLSHFEIIDSDIYTQADIYREDMCGCEDEQRYLSEGIQTVWLRLLVQGDFISLYRWNNQYFINTGDDYFIELINLIYDKPVYKIQLRDLAVRYGLLGKISKRIEQCRFESNELAEIIFTLNRGKGRVIPFDPPSYKLSFFAGMGAGIGNLDIYTMTNSPTIHFTNRGLSYFSLGVDFSPSFTTLFLRVELSSSSGSFIGESSAYGVNSKRPIYKYQHQDIVSSLSVLNKFWDDGILNIFGGLTINQNLSTYERNFNTVLLSGTGWQADIDMKRSWRSLGVIAGAIFNQRLEASFIVKPGGKFVSAESVVIKNSAFFLTFRYYFKRSIFR